MPNWPWRKSRPGVDEYGRSSLWHQAMEGDAAGIRMCLKEGSDPTAPDKDGFTSLHVAASYNRAEAIDLLIGAGADVNFVDKHGNGPLWTASFGALKQDYDLRIVTALLAASADMFLTNNAGRSPLHIAGMGPDALQACFRAAGFSNNFPS